MLRAVTGPPCNAWQVDCLVTAYNLQRWLTLAASLASVDFSTVLLNNMSIQMANLSKQQNFKMHHWDCLQNWPWNSSDFLSTTAWSQTAEWRPNLQNWCTVSVHTRMGSPTCIRVSTPIGWSFCQHLQTVGWPSAICQEKPLAFLDR